MRAESAEEGLKKSRLENAALNGLKVVVTGVTTRVSRETLEERLKALGAHVTGSVSGLTNLLVCGGQLEDGRPVEAGKKYQKAAELRASGASKRCLRILTEEQFFEQFPQLLQLPKLNRAALEHSRTAATATATQTRKYQLWSDRYRPVQLEEFAANQELLHRAIGWLQEWTPNRAQKALLLAGSPGTGKTSTAYSAAAHADYHVLEFNASDARSQSRLRQLRDLVTGISIGRNSLVRQKLLILMDEVDGMSSGDRGGVAELCTLIQLSRHPILLTCNDCNSLKMRPLLRICTTLHYQKCDRVSALARAKQICAREGVAFDAGVAARCFANCAGDMRYFINLCQLAFCMDQDHFQTEKNLGNYNSVYVVVKQLFSEAAALTPARAAGYYFTDYSVMPLFVEENGLNTLRGARTPAEECANLVRAADFLNAAAYAAVIDTKIRAENRWDLLPECAYFNSYLAVRNVNPRAVYRVEFPQFLGRLSSRRKHVRCYNTLSHHSKTTSASSQVLSGYQELLGNVAFEPFHRLPLPDALQHLIAFCRSYDLLSKELLLELLMDVRFKSAGNPYEQLAAKVKASVTKTMHLFDQVQQRKGAAKSAAAFSNKGSDTQELSEDVADAPPGAEFAEFGC